MTTSVEPPSIQRIEQFFADESRSRDVVLFRRCYAQVAGDVAVGLMLSQIVYWFLPSHNGRGRLSGTSDGWLVRSDLDWMQECFLTPKQAIRGISVLRAKGIIETKKKWHMGAPTLHLRLIPEVLVAQLDALDPILRPTRKKEKSEGKSFCPTGQILLPQEANPFALQGKSTINSETQEENLCGAQPLPVVLADKRAGKSTAKKEKPKNPMHARVRAIIALCYSHCNEGLAMPWGGEAAGKLSKLLSDAPGWQPRDWALCVSRRFGSTAAAVAEPPAAWIKSLPKYRASEFDRFGKAADSDSDLTVELMRACADEGLVDEECQ